MLQERLNRVVNNHQMTCEHTNHYIYILKGFSKLKDRLSVPVDAFDASHITQKKNMAITYEDALNFKTEIIHSLLDNAYDPWVVDFNFFLDGYLAATDAYPTAIPLNDGFLVTYPPLDWVPDRKTLFVFNQVDPLREFGVTEALDNQERYELLQTLE
ncbi:hypothetical protein G7062_02100 [Erysipelothrix sp. HDW6C]|uniref:hypothetical protein n=1 Tax=Erysipelothrix sp. HDW6C TaxID=2714930 RepID=UPI00140DEE6E|nr:hypothetical protein [Erysipelothrix sp. HDW6C]QIK69148.1 hypothetical protein G7062_02100 [Erysipelothrix sp. HDW6C]